MDDEKKIMYTQEELDLLEEMGEEPVVEGVDFTRVLVIDGFPKVAEDRKLDFKSYLQTQYFDQVGYPIIKQQEGSPLRENPACWFPMKDGKTIGVMFVQFGTEEQAKKFHTNFNNITFTKNNSLRINFYQDFIDLKDLNEEYSPPDERELVQHRNLKSWLFDKDGRDQYVIRHGAETFVYWNDVRRKRGRELYRGGNSENPWTQYKVQWSKCGIYLATFHGKGIVLRCGDSLDRMAKFEHRGVELVDFSPKDNYIVTCNLKEPEGPNDPACIIFWDIRGNKLKEFKSHLQRWPQFKWSSDEKYVARVEQDSIAVYSLEPGMPLVGGRTIPQKGVEACDWSPSQNYLSYWSPGVGPGGAASVVIMDVDKKKIVKHSQYFKASGIKMHWQSKGLYLLIRLKIKKNKTTNSTNYILFRINQKDIPAERVEMPNENEIAAFCWEPKGHRFALIEKVIDKKNKTSHQNVLFYKIRKNKIRLVNTLKGRVATHLHWSPSGKTIVLAKGVNASENIEFVNAKKFTSICKRDHFQMNQIQWDPSGRYVMTSSSSKFNKDLKLSSQSFTIWSQKGEALHTQKVQDFYQIQWRPRPQDVLPPKEANKVRQEITKWKTKYDSIDEKIRQQELSDGEKVRLRALEKWMTFRRAKEQFVNDEDVIEYTEDDYEEVQREVEEIISLDEETIVV